MTTSVLSFPARGNYGRSDYRGNCSGFVQKTMLDFYKPKVFVDPSCGSDTSGDVVKELNSQGRNIEYFGLDLHSGFNLLKDSLTEKIGGQRAQYVFYHPAYFDLVKYSGRSGMWGDRPHEDDLSHCASYEEFLEKLQITLQNIYEAIRGGFHYSILIGDVRRKGKYYSIQSDLIQLAPGKLDGVLIKTQHNVFSDRKTYANLNFIPIQHEYLLNFRKDAIVFGLLDATLASSKKLGMLSNANWSAIVAYSLQKLGGKGRLPEIYEVIEKTVPDRIRQRSNWQARIRATLQEKFRNLERGVWALNDYSDPRQKQLFAA
jgi:hypothetical protein